MKKAQVKIGGLYATKVTGKIVPVRIDAEHPHGGWKATNTQTNRPVRIKNAQRLRRPLSSGPAGRPASEDANDQRPSRQTVTAQAQADQENARLRDERETSPDGQTASERAMAESADDAATGAAEADKASKGTTRGKKRDTGERGASGGDGAGQPKRLSALDAAAKVLAETEDGKAALNCGQMIQQMAEKGYWKPAQGGKTPANTLYAAILREIGKKGADSRFRKVDRGRFELAK